MERASSSEKLVAFYLNRRPPVTNGGHPYFHIPVQVYDFAKMIVKLA